MQISPINYIKNNNISFSGSFKISNLDALISDFDIDEEKIEPREPKTIKEVENSDNSDSFSILRQTIDLDDEGTKTYITYTASTQNDFSNKLTSSILNICKDNQVNPKEDLFMISGLDDVNRRYILFNSFYKDEQTGADCAQMFYLVSQDELLTNLQKKIVKIFNDPKNRHFLSTSTSNNPLRNLAKYGSNIQTQFRCAIDNLDAISRDFLEEDYYDENGQVLPVIYSADGEYIKYKTIYFRK